LFFLVGGVGGGEKGKKKGPGAGAARALQWVEVPAVGGRPQLTGAPGGAPSTLAPIRAPCADTTPNAPAAAAQRERASAVMGLRTMVVWKGLKGCTRGCRMERCLVCRLAQMIKTRLSLSKPSCPVETLNPSFKCGMRHSGGAGGATCAASAAPRRSAHAATVRAGPRPPCRPCARAPAAVARSASAPRPAGPGAACGRAAGGGGSR
jgi:hypothetical protein